jgi:hypothetical protein
VVEAAGAAWVPDEGGADEMDEERNGLPNRDEDAPEESFAGLEEAEERAGEGATAMRELVE